MSIRIALGTDHAGFHEKNHLIEYLAGRGYSPVDCGTFTPESTDYPIYSARVARAVSTGAADLGIILCRQGNGMAMVANRHHGVRAGIAVNTAAARLTREHNNANVLVLAADNSQESMTEIVDAWLDARFDDGGRHERRVNLIGKLDQGASSPVATQQLVRAGQSPWLDDMGDELLSSGIVELYSAEFGLRGMTSNPSIFDKAISAGKGRYPAEIERLARAGADARAAYEELTAHDIRRAADLLRPVFEATGGDDGYVSLEVEPRFGDDEEATVSEAKRLQALLDRPNVFIKIPATAAGLRAIRRVIAAGINVNVTLMFTVKHYTDVAEAYIAGLRDRHAAGEPIHNVRSVASVFVSRWDVAIQEQIEKDPKLEPLRDKLGVAVCAACYAEFQRLFWRSGFDDLLRAGASVQRPLWASTSVKTPGPRPTYYVEELVAPYTVNTMPRPTFDAMVESGTVCRDRLPAISRECAKTIGLAAELGLDLDAMGNDLQVAGLRSFSESFDHLFQTLQQRLAAARV